MHVVFPDTGILKTVLSLHSAHTQFVHVYTDDRLIQVTHHFEYTVCSVYINLDGWVAQWLRNRALKPERLIAPTVPPGNRAGLCGFGQGHN